MNNLTKDDILDLLYEFNIDIDEEEKIKNNKNHFIKLLLGSYFTCRR